MVTFLVVLLMVYTFRNLLGLLESAIMLLTSTLEINVYRRHYELISKYNVGLKTLLSDGLSEPEFYGDLVYKFKKLIGSNDFSFQFRKIITRYRRIGYNLNVMRQSACLVLTQSRLITMLPSLIARRWVGRQTI